MLIPDYLYPVPNFAQCSVGPQIVVHLLCIVVVSAVIDKYDLIIGIILPVDAINPLLIHICNVFLIDDRKYAYMLI